jgi:hypothetical protein
MEFLWTGPAGGVEGVADGAYDLGEAADDLQDDIAGAEHEEPQLARSSMEDAERCGI